LSRKIPSQSVTASTSEFSVAQAFTPGIEEPERSKSLLKEA